MKEPCFRDQRFVIKKECGVGYVDCLGVESVLFRVEAFWPYLDPQVLLTDTAVPV